MVVDVAKVVLVSPTWLGDAVMSLPLVGFLGSAKDVSLTVAVRGATGRVYWGLEGLNDLVVSPDNGRLRRIWGQRAVTRRIDADGALILPPSFSSALGVLLGGVRTRVGFRSDARRCLLTESIDPRPLRNEHLSENYLRLGRLLLGKLGVSPGDVFATPKMKTLESERNAVAARLDRVNAKGDYAVVVPGATYGSTKSWPAEKYRELVRLLSREIFVVLGGSGAERGLCAAVGDGASRAVNLAGETTLGEFAALLECARVVVANDSGAPHIAASLGVPVVVIFGSTSPRWTAPLGKEVHVIREPVHCSPCFRRRCPTRLECYEGISVGRVLDTTRTVLKKRVEKKGPC